MPVEVMIAADRGLLESIRKALRDAASSVRVVGAAGDSKEAEKLCLEKNPDIAVLDIDLHGMCALISNGAFQKQCHDTRMLVLASRPDTRLIADMLNGGASGFILKENAGDELLTAIDAVGQGEAYLSPAVATVVVRELL